ncbi:MAG: glycosyltransferase family 8 protein [Clostridia bacterium]|nr:glycosyltransferase family 8 protein [Clostridia bacterium]
MIPIIYAGNYGIFQGILISLLSVVENTSKPVCVYLFTMDLTEKNEKFKPLTAEQAEYLDKMCKERNPESSVQIVDVGEFYKSALIDSPNAVTSYTPYTFLRLFADKIDFLPSKVIYLDADTVVAKDISELYDVDITDYEFAGVLDYYGHVFIGARYINAGVLLLNLERIKKTSLFEKCIELLNKKRVFLPDQTALNKFAEAKLIIDRKFNEQKRFEDATVVQHFAKTIKWLPFFHTQNIKPWHTELVKEKLTHKYDTLLDMAAKEMDAYKEQVAPGK